MKPRRPNVVIKTLPVLWVDTPEALAELDRHLEGATRLALDTEFVRDRQYRPRLEIIQLATDDLLAVLDYRALQSLGRLAECLLDDRVLKVMHAARQDLEILYDLLQRVPRPLADTQVAASIVGIGAQVGYANLVRQVLGIELKKAQTLTNWSHRPLSPHQIEYALDDVRYLLPLWDELARRLDAMQRIGWFWEEMERVSEPHNFAPHAPDDVWRSFKGASRLRRTEQAALRALAALRERIAREHDMALPFVLRDQTLLYLARRRPSSLQELADVHDIPDWLLEQYGPELLDALVSAEHEKNAKRPKKRRALTQSEHEFVDVLLAWVQVRAREANVAPDTLATREDLEHLLASEPEARTGLPLLQGWRREVVGESLLALLEGRAALMWNPVDGRLEYLNLADDV
ncbi:ribonuclease D [Ardenticatena maritima]|uniref:Ribonuclease D n=1 Tax=Ardenticatena maritima TaxID=872965 RepID=A0A0M8KAH1_9CHLR|nr:ribonuclease D [Ardenticatena maritima]KPL89140.1 hypothetical protein SE16_01060 [Ardenticatena maritima]GAP63769.1 ribonuclease D [Ardenticatena maritima]